MADIAAGKTVLTTVSSGHIGSWRDRAPEATEIEPDAGSIEKWWYEKAELASSRVKDRS